MSGAKQVRPVKAPPVLDFGSLGLPPASAAPAPPVLAAAPARPAVPAPPAGELENVPAQRAAVVPAAAAAPAAVVPVARKRARRKRARAAADDGTGVSLPITVARRLRDYARSAAGTGRSYTDITLDAVEATHARLPELLVPVLPPPRTGPLFAGRVPKRAQHGEGHQQVNLRFSSQDLAVVDALWPQVKAPNRSAMLAAALDAYLPREDGE